MSAARLVRLFLGAAIAVASLGCAHPAPESVSAPALAPPKTAGALPVSHVAPWTPHARAAIAAELDGAFRDGIFAQSGAVAVVDEAGRPLYLRRARVPMTPASTLKLVVAAAALNTFGPNHRFETAFVALAPPDDSGLLGELWFVGGGDPLLTANDLRGGIGALRRLGVRRLMGPLAVDASEFRGAEKNPHWDPGDLEEGYAAATSAVSLDQDTVEIHVTPGAPGSSARISIEPPNVNVVVGGEVTTEWGADDVEIVRSPGSPGDPLPLRNAFTLHGHVPPGPVRKYWKPVLGMPSYAGGAIVALLGERGIAAPDEVVFERAPVVAQTLWLHRSQPLGAIVTEMLVHSNNHSAEQLLRLVGAAASGGVGTDASGLAAARRELRRLGVPYAGMRAYDGSGLAPDDKIAPLTLAELVAAELRGSRGNAFLQALPRVGMEGTVQYHELHAALGHARAKSGHLSGVNALAGTVQTRSHGRVTFAFVVNDPRSESRAVYLAQDRALDLLAEF